MNAPSKIIHFLKRHRERAAVTGLLVGLIAFVGLGLTLQKSNREVVVKPEVASNPTKVELKLADTDGNMDSERTSTGDTAFFLRPTPTELLSQLESMKNLNADVVAAKFSALKMLWPVYFFSLEAIDDEKDKEKRTLLADVSEDGFGIIVKADMSLIEFPQLADVKRGMKIWVAGEILAIDPEGTGTIYMSAEYVRVGGSPVFETSQPKEVEK